MVTVDPQKCTRCHLCVKDCLAGLLTPGADGVPFMPDEVEKLCINCQHCLAICPAGALVCNGVTPQMCPQAGMLPEPDSMAALLKMRRSVRFYKDENIAPEIMKKLKASLAWSPTGCNDHRLIFHVVENKEDMAFFRDNTNKMLRFLVKSGILKLLFPRVKRYLSAILEGQDVIYRNAPHMIICSAPEKSPCKEADPWIALSYFDLYLQSFGLGSCWCGFAVRALKYNSKLRARLHLPKGYKVKSVLLFGIPAVKYARATAPENYRINN